MFNICITTIVKHFNALNNIDSLLNSNGPYYYYHSCKDDFSDFRPTFFLFQEREGFKKFTEHANWFLTQLDRKI